MTAPLTLSSGGCGQQWGHSGDGLGAAPAHAYLCSVASLAQPLMPRLSTGRNRALTSNDDVLSPMSTRPTNTTSALLGRNKVHRGRITFSLGTIGGARVPGTVRTRRASVRERAEASPGRST